MAPLIDPVRALLSAKDREFLATTFARNQARFGGWLMKTEDPPLDPEGGKPDEGGTPKQKAPEDGPDDKPLGPNGEKALKSERDARKAVAAELATLKQGLAAALGGNEDGGKPSTDDALAAITSQLADMKHENTVLALANQHKITDTDDIDLLRATRDGDALAKLAARLATTPAPTGGDGGKSKPGTPKPDPTQGGDGKPHGKPASVAQVIAERRAARAAKTSA